MIGVILLSSAHHHAAHDGGCASARTPMLVDRHPAGRCARPRPPRPASGPRGAVPKPLVAEKEQSAVLVLLHHYLFDIYGEGHGRISYRRPRRRPAPRWWPHDRDH